MQSDMYRRYAEDGTGFTGMPLVDDINTARLPQEKVTIFYII